MTDKKAKCYTCKHNIKKSSCGTCADKGTEMITNIAKELDIDLNHEQNNEVKNLKSSCKIILEYPDEYEEINPFKCKFYLPSVYNFY
jgi:hypothetical protein